jgi:hypothetical protein
LCLSFNASFLPADLGVSAVHSEKIIGVHRRSSRSNGRHPAVSRTSNNEESGEIIGMGFTGGKKNEIQKDFSVK